MKVKVEGPKVGRPPLPPGHRLVPVSIRMHPADFAKFTTLGGRDWLVKQLKKVKVK